MSGAIAVNWYIKFKKRIEFLEDKNRKLLTKNNFLQRKLKEYEDNNIRSTRDR
jgi:hypothetical protein